VPRSFQVPTILIVDDDKGIQKLLEDHLSGQGFLAIAEKDGDWALRTFESREVHLVLLDLLLPGMNGFQVAERIRKHPRGGSTPIVMMSGIYKSSLHKSDARAKYGISGYLDKPFGPEQVDAVLRKHLGSRYPSPTQATLPVATEPERLADEGAHDEAAWVEEISQVTTHPNLTGEVAAGDGGTLAARPFPELLADAYRKHTSGALLLQRDKVKKLVYFRGGSPVFVKSNLLRECLGHVMVRAKMISEQECEESIRKMKKGGRQQGTVLIEMGRISPHNLVFALELQLQQKLYEIFAWTDGEWQLDTAAELPPATVELGMSAAALICEGVKRAWGDERARRALGPIDDQYVHPGADPLHRLQDAGLAPEEMALLESIDGTCTVKELRRRSAMAEGDLLRFLYAMRAAQVVTFRAEADADANERTIDTSSPPTLPGQMAYRDPPPPTRKRRGMIPDVPTGEVQSLGNPEEVEIRSRLVAQLKAMRKMDHFAVLGLGRDATKDQVKRAYFALAKSYHPDKNFQAQSPEVRKLAGEILQVVGRAHDTLVDDEGRERYLRELAQGVKQSLTDEVSRILAAEGRFERGEELLRGRQFAEAHRAFAEAVGIYPDEGEFHAYLAWSLFQSDPKDRAKVRSAMDSLEHAIRLNPKVDKAYLFLGYIHKATGRPDKAEKEFEKAIQCNPDCTEALRELRLLGKAKRT
jgi:CheY-like chemotaxis protein